MAEPGAAFELEFAEMLFDDICVRGVGRPRVHLGQVVLDVDEETPQRRGDSGARGTMTVGMSSSFATSAPCNAPAPPKAMRAKSRGSRPRRIETRRTASAMLALATLMMESAAA